MSGSVRQDSEDSLEWIGRISAISRGSDFFFDLVREARRALKMDMCLIARVLNEPITRLATIAVDLDAGRQPNFEYDVAGMPCERVMRNGIYYCRTQLARLHPEDHEAIALGLESYMGITLLGRGDRILGHIAVLAREPISDPAHTEAVLRIFAARAAAEIENAELLERLEASTTALRKHNAEMQRELSLAVRLQRRLLPPRLPAGSGLSVASLFQPMLDVGGDFFDVIERGDFIGLFLCDVSGHGVAAAMVAAMVKISLHEAARSEDDPGRVLEKMNASLLERVGGNFCTAIYIVFDRVGNCMRYARAGHPPPLLIDNATGAWNQLQSRGALLGALASPQPETCTVPLSPGLRVLLYTDGLLEHLGADGEEQMNALARIFTESPEAEPDNLMTLSLSRVQECSPAGFEDDLTALLIEVQPDFARVTLTT